MPPPREVPNFLEGPGDWKVTSTVHSDTYPAIDPSQFDLKGKVVLITGASRGIGQQAAISFARAGADLALAARSSLSELQSLVGSHVKVLCLKVDVSDTKSVQAGVDMIKETFGRLDIVLNNAGVAGEYHMIEQADPDEWWDCVTMNFRSQMLVTRATLPLMKSSDGPRTYLSTASVFSHLPMPTCSSYGISKAMMPRFAEFIAAEYAVDGVIAIAIHPGCIMTDLVKDLEDWQKAVFVDTPALAADTMVWLSAERREWLNGRYVPCIWDMPELEAKKDAIIAGDRLKVKLDVDF